MVFDRPAGLPPAGAGNFAQQRFHYKLRVREQPLAGFQFQCNSRVYPGNLLRLEAESDHRDQEYH